MEQIPHTFFKFHGMFSLCAVNKYVENILWKPDLRNSYLSKHLITILGNNCPTCFSCFIEVKVIRDADKANQDKIAAHLFCVYSSCDRNNMKSLQRQIDFNVINHFGTNTEVIKRVDCIKLKFDDALLLLCELAAKI